VTAYVIDTPVEVTHPEFEGRAEIGKFAAKLTGDVKNDSIFQAWRMPPDQTDMGPMSRV